MCADGYMFLPFITKHVKNQKKYLQHLQEINNKSVMKFIYF